MIAGDRTWDMDWALDDALAIGATVVSVEYRLAPEASDLELVQDCYAGLVWTAEHADDLGIDVERLLIMGVSAGGGLAAGVALMARDAGGPRLAGQLLMCPMLDDRRLTVSSTMLHGQGVWDSVSNQTGWEAVLGARAGGPDVSYYVAPARATDLAGLPPTFMDVATGEVFRDEVVDFARRMWLANGDVELHVWPGGYHGFFQFAPDLPMSKSALRVRHDWILRRLGSGTPASSSNDSGTQPSP
jgi:acetyl esterase/lipase